MVKKSKKERVVEYEEDDIVCDLCEKVIPPENTFITILPAVARSNGLKWNPSGEDLRMDICSADCLSKNVGAVNLVFNTKTLPETRSRKAKADRDNKASREEMDNFKQYAQQYQKATQTSPGTIQWQDSTGTAYSSSTPYIVKYTTAANGNPDVFNGSNTSTI